MAREEEAGGSDVLGHKVWCDVTCALVLHEDLLVFELVAHMVDLEGNMRRLGGDGGGSCELDGGVVVLQHDRWRGLGVA